VLTVRAADGTTIRRIEGPVTRGFHRVAWDLRYPRPNPWQPEVDAPDYVDYPGPLAAPGTYTVTLARRIDGQLVDLGQEQSFEVVSIVERGLPGASPEEVAAFNVRLDDLRRQVLGAGASIRGALTEVTAIKSTLPRSGAPGDLHEAAHRIERELKDIQQGLSGNERRSLYGDVGPMSVSDRLQVALTGTFRSTYGPTPTHREALSIAETAFAGLEERLGRILRTDLPELRAQLDAQGVPWTPGRGIPGND